MSIDVLVVEQMLQDQESREGATLEYRDAIGFVKAYQFLHELSQRKDAGLIDNNVIYELHKILMSHRSHLSTVGNYSTRDRVVEFKGKLHFYPNPFDMEETMQRFIDEYNHRWFTVNCFRKTNNRKAVEYLVHLTA